MFYKVNRFLDQNILSKSGVLTREGESVHIVDKVNETQYSDSHEFEKWYFAQIFSSSRLLLL